MKCDKCSKSHPTILHDETKSPSTNFREDNIQPSIPEENLPGTSTQSTVCATRNTSSAKNKIILPHVPVKVRMFNGPEVIVNCALDTCATDCWASDRLIRKLNLKTQSKPSNVTCMLGKDLPTRTGEYNLYVSDLGSNNTTCLPVLFKKPVDVWPFSEEDLLDRKELKALEYLNEVPFECSKECIDLLIGSNIPELLMPLEIVRGPKNMPYASRHSLGWALNGPVPRKSTKIICNRISVSEGLTLDSEINRLFAQDFTDPNPVEKSLSFNDSRFLNKIENSIVKTPDNHFEIGLPLKENSTFPQNRKQALGYFLNTKKRLDRNRALHDDYNEFMNNMFEMGFAEIIPVDELRTTSQPVWYITHHPVYHKQKNKIRIVFNCSLKCQGKSLNDNLYQGPDLTSSLFGVLLRFRQNPVAVIADIQKMFYQVRVPKSHANLLRFFWINGSSDVVECRLLVHVFGAISSPSVAQFALKETVRNMNENESTSKAINNNFYVDDLLKSYIDSKTAVQEIPKIINTLDQGGFTLTCFNSNSADVLRVVDEERRSPTVSLPSADHERALGVIWNIKKDTLGYKISLENNPNITKRSLLKVLASIYDPQGFISPVLLHGKRLFQESCKLHLD